MCGILGYLLKGGRTIEPELFGRALDAMAHRGPDDRGVWAAEGAALGFRRLSILDLPSGRQPMGNEDGSLQIVFNGEIYNFAELRARLESRGHRFRTRSDTEAILHLYEEEGEGCVRSLRGMFAFAILDPRRRSLFLARDRFGKKPLVYCETPTGFYFASEIGALLQVADCSRDASLEGLDAYLALGYVPGAMTAWRDLRRLPAGCSMRVEASAAAAPQPYWRLDWSPAEPPGEQEALEGLRARLEESARLRMVADVPLGAFLSGGVDSSVTVAAMVRAGARIKTFSVGFDDPRFDESRFARDVAVRLGTDHHEAVVKADSLEALAGLVGKLGEPFADQSILPTFLLSAFTREHVTVALSGDGGDELFAGYKRYAHLRRAAWLRGYGLEKTWSAASRALFALEQFFNPSRRHLKWPRSAVDRILGLPPAEQYLRLTGSWPQPLRGPLWRAPVRVNPALEAIGEAARGAGKLADTTRWQAVDAGLYLADDILRKVDAASMACSLECRCPLLDQEVAAYAAALPERFKWGARGDTKVLLKRLYPDLLPPSLFDRPKKGFSMPIGKWMRGRWKEAVGASVLEPASAGLERCLDRSQVRRAWDEHQEGCQDHGQRLWAWHVLCQWDRAFKPNWPS